MEATPQQLKATAKVVRRLSQLFDEYGRTADAEQARAHAERLEQDAEAEYQARVAYFQAENAKHERWRKEARYEAAEGR